MERIFPPEIKAQMLRRGKLTVTETHSEIGIYSSVFVDISKSEDYILENKTYGRLLRTKGTESDEGGINTGFSVIDQPFLIEVGDLRTSKI
jgi:glutathione synthase